MNDNYRKAGDIISSIFDNISMSDMENSLNVINGWKSVIRSIKSAKNKNMGEYLVAHSKVIDLKNNILLVEVDHPAYIQTFQIYNNYILKGLKMKYPELEIKNLSFRLKGSTVKLHDVIPEKKQESEEKTEEIKNDGEEFEVNKDLPPELRERFQQIKDSILTNDK